MILDLLSDPHAFYNGVIFRSNHETMGAGLFKCMVRIMPIYIPGCPLYIPGVFCIWRV